MKTTKLLGLLFVLSLLVPLAVARDPAIQEATDWLDSIETPQDYEYILGKIENVDYLRDNEDIQEKVASLAENFGRDPPSWTTALGRALEATDKAITNAADDEVDTFGGLKLKYVLPILLVLMLGGFWVIRRTNNRRSATTIVSNYFTQMRELMKLRWDLLRGKQALVSSCCGEQPEAIKRQVIHAIVRDGNLGRKEFENHVPRDVQAMSTKYDSITKIDFYLMDFTQRVILTLKKLKLKELKDVKFESDEFGKLVQFWNKHQRVIEGLSKQEGGFLKEIKDEAKESHQKYNENFVKGMHYLQKEFGLLIEFLELLNKSKEIRDQENNLYQGTSPINMTEARKVSCGNQASGGLAIENHLSLNVKFQEILADEDLMKRYARSVEEAKKTLESRDKRIKKVVKGTWYRKGLAQKRFDKAVRSQRELPTAEKAIRAIRNTIQSELKKFFRSKINGDKDLSKVSPELEDIKKTMEMMGRVALSNPYYFVRESNKWYGKKKSSRQIQTDLQNSLKEIRRHDLKMYWSERSDYPEFMQNSIYLAKVAENPVQKNKTLRVPRTIIEKEISDMMVVIGSYLRTLIHERTRLSDSIVEHWVTGRVPGLTLYTDEDRRKDFIESILVEEQKHKWR